MDVLWNVVVPMPLPKICTLRPMETVVPVLRVPTGRLIMSFSRVVAAFAAAASRSERPAAARSGAGQPARRAGETLGYRRGCRPRLCQ